MNKNGFNVTVVSSHREDKGWDLEFNSDQELEVFLMKLKERQGSEFENGNMFGITIYMSKIFYPPKLKMFYN